MSAHTQQRPVNPSVRTVPGGGERARAHVTSIQRDDLSTKVTSVVLEDGSLVISPEYLAKIGRGSIDKGRNQIRLMLKLEVDHPVAEGPTEKPKTVRGGGPADEQAILDLLLLDVAENAARIAPPNEERILGHIQNATQRRGGLVGVIDSPDGKIVACCLMASMKWWWSEQIFVQELVLYVHPDHRQSNHLNDLLQFQRWAVDAWTKDFGFRVYLLCGVLGVHKVREKILMYRRKFRQAGAAFVYPSPFERE